MVERGAELRAADLPEESARPAFGDFVLGGVAVVIAIGVLMTVGLFLLPREPLVIPEVQPTMRVAAVEDFPVGASRIVDWGDQIILVIHRSANEYFAVEGSAPSDGCILRWDVQAQRVVSPCTFVVYDVRGNVVTGLTTTPLRRYRVLVRSGDVYVSG